MKNALILLAGGEGQRFDKSVPKQFFKVGNYNFIEYFLRNLDPNIFSIICIVFYVFFCRVLLYYVGVCIIYMSSEIGA